MTTHDAPIGVFDSGLGGLSVLDAMRARLPSESMVYIADSGHAPYGEKTDAFIRQRSKAIADWFVARGAKIIVVACNTATTHAIRYLRDTLSIPIVGVEPGIKPAALATASGVVGVLATAATLRSDRLKTLIAEHETRCRFVCQAGHGLVEQIEQGNLNGAVIDDLLTRYLTPMAQAGADTVILGSTHFALLAPAIRRLFGERFALIETGTAVARRVDALLAEHGLAAQVHPGSGGRTEFFSTAGTARQREALLAVVAGLSTTTGAPWPVSYVEIAHALTEPQH
ncbi:glutamate racemase [Trinickia dabaoshanensis]|uniref:Glutamate racemase n=1 Tax=Trinickia dabaoshanensis TaxID=564714 RepID=A0A2N7VWX4_9BURK|nr:glutamate racemase [Trinickia dabaoshanensis]PMS21654.1 glutamate racemase [Trinickia dabaoshanensis]